MLKKCRKLNFEYFPICAWSKENFQRPEARKCQSVMINTGGNLFQRPQSAQVYLIDYGFAGRLTNTSPQGESKDHVEDTAGVKTDQDLPGQHNICERLLTKWMEFRIRKTSRRDGRTIFLRSSTYWYTKNNNSFGCPARPDENNPPFYNERIRFWFIVFEIIYIDDIDLPQILIFSSGQLVREPLRLCPGHPPGPSCPSNREYDVFR